MDPLHLREADRVEIMILADNYTDLLLFQDTEVVKRPRTPLDRTPLAEHGLSCLITVAEGSEEHTVLMDASLSAACLLHNLDVFEVDVDAVEAVFLSHGHPDHFGGLLGFLKRARRGIPVILHPDAFMQRRLQIPGMFTRDLPRLDEAALKEAGATIHTVEEPSLWFSDLVLALGKVRRVTDFEKGFPLMQAEIQGSWMVDPFHDDHGLVLRVRDKGLVVLGGCSHAGIINTVRYAQAATGEERVHAVLGGFHLSGPLFEPIIGNTIEEMKRIGPDVIVPMHCTGWKAIHRFEEEMPAQFLLNSVGSRYIFQ